MYRIFTEDVNRDQIQVVMNLHFDGYSLYPVTGVYQNTKEHGLIIEVVSDDDDNIHNAIMDAAKEIKAVNHQQSVIVQHIPNTCEFV